MRYTSPRSICSNCCRCTQSQRTSHCEKAELSLATCTDTSGALASVMLPIASRTPIYSQAAQDPEVGAIKLTAGIPERARSQQLITFYPSIRTCPTSLFLVLSKPSERLPATINRNRRQYCYKVLPNTFLSFLLAVLDDATPSPYGSRSPST